MLAKAARSWLQARRKQAKMLWVIHLYAKKTSNLAFLASRSSMCAEGEGIEHKESPLVVDWEPRDSSSGICGVVEVVKGADSVCRNSGQRVRRKCKSAHGGRGR